MYINIINNIIFFLTFFQINIIEFNEDEDDEALDEEFDEEDEDEVAFEDPDEEFDEEEQNEIALERMLCPIICRTHWLMLCPILCSILCQIHWLLALQLPTLSLEDDYLKSLVLHRGFWNWSNTSCFPKDV